MNRLPRATRACATILLIACVSVAAAQVPTELDWDTNAWPGGSLSETFTVGPGDVQISWSGDTGALVQGRPVTAQVETGGLIPAEDSLSIRVNYSDTSAQEIGATIDFTHPGGVTDASFTVFDIDTGSIFFNPWVDQVQVTATDGVSTFNPSSVTVVDPAYVNFDGTNTVTGLQTLFDSTSPLGNASFTFNQPGITRITLAYREPPGALADPGVQYISIHDINFTYEASGANLALTKSVSTVRDPLGATVPAALAIPGAVVQYEVSVSNSGGGAATEAIITDTLNSNLTFLAGEFDGGTADVEIIVGAAAPVYCIAEVGGDTNADGCFLNAAGDFLTVSIPVSGPYPTGLTVGTTAPDNVVVVHFRATVN